MKDFADLLKDYREKHGLTQTELAGLLHVSQTRISHIERRDNLRPGPLMLLILEFELGIPWRTLKQRTDLNAEQLATQERYRRIVLNAQKGEPCDTRS